MVGLQTEMCKLDSVKIPPAGLAGTLNASAVLIIIKTVI